MKAMSHAILDSMSAIAEDMTDQAFALDPNMPAAGVVLKAFGDESRLHTDRTVEYLKWRYIDIPGFVYSSASRIDGEDGALILWRNRLRRNLHELSISEILIGTGKKSMDIGNRIMDEILHQTKADYLVAIAARNTPEASLLKRLRFLPLPGVGPVLTVKPINDPRFSINICDWTNWRCSIGDLEIF